MGIFIFTVIALSTVHLYLNVFIFNMKQEVEKKKGFYWERKAFDLMAFIQPDAQELCYTVVCYISLFISLLQ